ncbi:MAG: hypothetical protein OEW00_00980 [candidate division Zixibacteria bacterium]|nr:hypothetical protein [candidate division Zixibacteria bacterium]
MQSFRNVLVFALLLFGTVEASVESEFFKEFKKAYGLIDQDLLNNEAEVARVKDFVYQKDVATFTFKDGTMYLMRYLDDRPTTAFFIGEGNASIQVPPRVEKRALAAIVSDTAINDDFQFCFIHMADDFDLKLREKFTFNKESLSWKPYNAVKQEQGEFFFKPLILHKYDNCFQLLRSHYERSGDGYFWIDFNRFIFTYDPNRHEQVIVSYEHEGGDQVASDGAVFQKKETGCYDDRRLSDITYQTTILEKSGTIEMEGLDGGSVKQAGITVLLEVNVDSLRFLSMFLDKRLNLDSVSYDGRPVDFHRRGDFTFFGVILPEYRYKGDTLSITSFYHGREYTEAFPYIDNPQVSRQSFTFIIPKGYNYFMPGMSLPEKLDGRREQFNAAAPNKLRSFYFRPFAAGLDTLPVTTEIGISLNFLKWKLMTKKYSNCFIPDNLYESTMAEAFNFMCGRFGPPPGTFEVFASPAGYLSMPGLMEAPQIACVTEGPMAAYGGFDAVAGLAAAKQWFGPLLQPATDRETWLVDALPEFVSLVYLNSKLGSTYFTNLISRRDSLYMAMNDEKKMPLAAGSRSPGYMRANKGLWIFHMLRFMMRDFETQSDQQFLKFLREIMMYYNNRKFTNDDFIQLAEKYYGQPLTAFFDYWLYGGEIPEFDVEYSINRRDDGYYIDVAVAAKNVDASFSLPVALRVPGGDGNSTFLRKQIEGAQTSLHLGPYAKAPQELIFNEFFSVLSIDRISKK